MLAFPEDCFSSGFHLSRADGALLANYQYDQWFDMLSFSTKWDMTAAADICPFGAVSAASAGHCCSSSSEHESLAASY